MNYPESLSNSDIAMRIYENGFRAVRNVIDLLTDEQLDKLGFPSCDNCGEFFSELGTDDLCDQCWDLTYPEKEEKE